MGITLKLTASCVLTSMMLAACSAPTEPGAEGANDTPADSTDAPEKPREMPLPKANWTKSSNLAHYKIFEKHDDALAWFNTWKASPVGVAHGDSKIDVISLEDARYETVEKEVAAVWGVFRKLFPNETEGLTAPPFVVLIDKPGAEAFAVYDRTLEVSPHAFMVGTGLLTDDNGKATSRAALHGLIAHELAHHVLKHQWPGVGDKVARHYSAKNAVGAKFGFEQTDDAATRKTVTAVTNLQGWIGKVTAPELSGVPLSGGTLMYIMAAMHKTAAAVLPSKCEPATAALKAASVSFQDSFDPVTQTFDPTPAKREELARLTSEFIRLEPACAAGSTKSFYELGGEAKGTTAAEFKSSLTQGQIDLIERSKTPFETIVTWTKSGIDATAKFPTDLRFYSTEEEADDVAVNVLFETKDDPQAFHAMLVREIGTAEQEVACTRLAEKSEPPYGSLSDDHHSPCWRTWHAAELTQYLSGK